MLARFLVLALLLFSCCASPGLRVGEAAPAQDPVDMMDSTVRVRVEIQAERMTAEENQLEQVSRVKWVPMAPRGWTGSGVVVDKRVGVLGDVKSLILSANHVLEAPKVGDTMPLTVRLAGMELTVGIARISAVTMTIRTAGGAVCSLEPRVTSGHVDTRDVATGVADCDAGRVAKLGTREPHRGEKVYLTGYPLGVENTIVTEGYACGISDSGYQAISAPSVQGNSGGPMWYNGEVVGLLTRVLEGYANTGYAVPLSELKERVAETNF